ncbi:MAG: DUF4037 domain-containing protein [Oscillospiraceae bacterium]|nr:DUF4037 domain-containing protein [Oscillospiraceae bacterium]
MNGLTLSRKYYEQVGRPALEEKFGKYMPRIAAGLVGEGSECFGFDDSISRDHDFGPGFCIWLSKEDFAAVGRDMQQFYNALPKEFMGYPARNTSAHGNGRVGVVETETFYRQFIGNEQPPKSLMRWLYLPEHKIATAVNGEVFEDNLGEFSAIRSVLAQYYPEDIRIKKIAARAAAMAQAGQYNYGRCMRRGDFVAADIAKNEFVKNTLSMLYLLNRTYAPYYKWQFHGLKKLAAQNKDFAASQALPLLEKLCCCENQADAWQEPHPQNWNPYVNVYDKKVVLIERICDAVITELKKQKLTDGREDFLEAHTMRIMGRICDSEIRRCHITEG